jgi:hypothetical protein
VHARHALREFGQPGAMVAARCPYRLNLVMRQTGALWGAGQPTMVDRAATNQPGHRTLWRVTERLIVARPSPVWTIYCITSRTDGRSRISQTIAPRAVRESRVLGRDAWPGPGPGPDER